MKARNASLVLLAPLVASMAACQWLVALRGAEVTADVDASDDGATAPDAHIPAAPDPCGPVPPGPPASDVGANRPSQPPFFFAVRRWAFRNDGPDKSPLFCDDPGFNLDGKNTWRGDAATGCAEQRSCVTPTVATACDYEHGVDNALPGVLDLILQVPGVNPGARTFDPNRVIEVGATNLLLELDDYNGEADDRAVRVRFWVAAREERLRLPRDGGSPVVSIADLASMPVVWDGGGPSSWVVDRRSILGEAGSELVTSRYLADGYVTGGVLVVPETGPGLLPISVPGGGGTSYRSGVLVAGIERSVGADGVVQLALSRGRLAMRMPSASLLSVVGNSRNPSSTKSGQLCEPRNASDYQSFARTTLCGRLDLPMPGSTDETLNCGELSAALFFSSVQSALSRVDGGRVLAIEDSTLGSGVPCPDDAGTQWCDDCAWSGPSRCDAGTPSSDASAD